MKEISEFVNKIHLEKPKEFDVLKQIPDNSIDCMVTDPPYGIKFMGKKWDYEIPSVDCWKECLRVLKPGGYALIACGTRTQHRMVCNVEDAGFIVKDVISWVYSSGFPKNHNIAKAVDQLQGNKRELIGEKKLWGHNAGSGACSFSKNKYDGVIGKIRYEEITKGNSEFEGQGTALKPSCEFWTLVQKPLSEKTYAENVLKWGTGGLNIDACRVGSGAKKWSTPKGGIFKPSEDNEAVLIDNNKGRYPANLIYDGSEEVVSLFPDSNGQQGDLINHNKDIISPNGIFGKMPPRYDAYKRIEDNKSASRFFYCAKVSRRERERGLDWFEKKSAGIYAQDEWSRKNMGNTPDNEREGLSNNHATVKPIKLMQYLIKLLSREQDIVLDPFAGSGSTLIACKLLNRNYIGMDIDQEYINIANGRIAGWKIEDFEDIEEEGYEVIKTEDDKKFNNTLF